MGKKKKSNKKDASINKVETKQEDLKTIKRERKSKVITSKVYPETWEKFTAINKLRGMSSNSVVNMLISDYVASKEDLLK